MATFFEKFRQNPQIFEVWSLGLNLEFQVSVSELLMKSRFRRFNQVSVAKVTVSTTLLIFWDANEAVASGRPYSEML